MPFGSPASELGAVVGDGATVGTLVGSGITVGDGAMVGAAVRGASVAGGATVGCETFVGESACGGAVGTAAGPADEPHAAIISALGRTRVSIASRSWMVIGVLL